MWPSSWRPSPSCSGRGTSMRASTTREWSRPSPSSRWSSCWRSSASACSSPTECIKGSATCSRAPLPRAIWPNCSPSMRAPVIRAGSRSPCSRCWRFSSCHDSSRCSWSRTSTSGTSRRPSGYSRSISSSSISSCCPSPSAACSTSRKAAWTPTRSCWRCRWPSVSKRSRCLPSSAGFPPRPA